MLRLCLIAASAVAAAASAQSPSAFVGDWRLVSFVQPDSTGGLHDQWGPRPLGLIHYSADGTMAAQLYDERRKPLGVSNFQDVSAADARAAFVGLTSYFGTYSIDTTAKTVTHAVEGAMAPDWIGRKLIRGYRFLTPDRIELRVITGVDGRPTTYGQVVVWERVKRGRP